MEEKRMGVLRCRKDGDTYTTIVITNRRIIFVQLTNQMLKGWTWVNYHLRSGKYWNMEPAKILQESVSNFAVENSDINSIEIRYFAKGEGEEAETYWGLTILTTDGLRVSHTLSKYPRKLRQVFGEKVNRYSTVGAYVRELFFFFWLLVVVPVIGFVFPMLVRGELPLWVWSVWISFFLLALVVFNQVRDGILHEAILTLIQRLTH